MKQVDDPTVADAQTETATPDDNAETLPLPPIKPRPLLFKISLVAFIGWLVYLAYIAYIVLA